MGCGKAEKTQKRNGLFPHQKFIRDYMQHESPYRGILLYHGLGVGKTCASISVAEIVRNHRKVVVILPAALQTNYRDEIMECGSIEYSVHNKWSFVDIREALESKESEESIKEKLRSMKIRADPKLTKKLKGFWMTKKHDTFPSSAPKDFHTLTTEQQQQVKDQIYFMVSSYSSYIFWFLSRASY